MGATQISMTYQVDPFSSMGQEWVKRLRRATSKHSEVGRWHVSGEGPTQMDAAAITFAKFPLMIFLMMLVVFVLIGLSFGSLVAPLRAIVCLTWMLAVTFGLSTCVFQDGALNWLNWAQLSARSSGAMSWMSPSISCSVLVGLGLDYDIFYSEQVAAVRALAATANTISAAGVIMMVA